MDNWKEKLVNELKIRGYSRKTIRSYLFHVEKYIGSGLNPKEFLLQMVDRQKSKSTIRVAGFAVKFYLKHVENKADGSINAEINKIPNIKSEKKLPEILSKKEIEDMVLTTKNLKHRLIIQMIYAAGLRAGEVINIQWKDIDFGRNTIHIKLAKGAKDRVVMLSSRLKKGLLMLTKERDGMIFKSSRDRKYSLGSIEKIVKNAALKAGIKKKITPHSLRHSFATHLLEKGTDIRYIKELLGHARVETTMIYTKVSNRDLIKIKSPLD